MKKSSGPLFLRYCLPIIDILKKLGGSGKASEVTDLVIENLGVSESEQSELLKNGTSKLKNRIAWARFYLSKDGLLESSSRGVWSLTEKATKSQLQESDITELFRNVHKQFEKNFNDKKLDDKIIETENEEIAEHLDYKTELLKLLKDLPPAGFERICQRLLRESGFEEVSVTGRTGDGGIDGHGILQINLVVSFKVLFQCKRYNGTVGAGAVRDFRGAMAGRADKGIILTTGSFTTEAKKEAVRDGVSPIELVDGDRIVKMFEIAELGLRPKTTYEIDYKFFDDFKVV
ncbi:MAG TPA: restriction endonuclease [Lentisphaeria bacterium]|nr:MAG: restriction endonuclease [Lentisphaerae bacterium GWF2_50_93]HCE46579.1 restriction endonuclease [Lentisphaeria bacterium]